jgi:aspartate aminotransferase
MIVSNLSQHLKGSEIIKIAGEINELKRKGASIANLTIGDFDPSIYTIPDTLKDGIKAAYDAHQTNYPPADGLVDLRESVCDFLKDRHGMTVTPDEVLISSGSRPIIYATFLALVDPGDKVVFPGPSWNNNHYCNLTGAEPVIVATLAENNFMPTADELKPHLRGATLLALCSPLNPTGTMFSKENLEQICDLVIEENRRRRTDEKPLYILYDQIYAMLTFGGYRHYDPVSLRPGLKEYVVYVDGASKCFAATGVRVGWGFGPKAVISNMRAITGHMGAWAPKAEQIAMAEFLRQKTQVDTYLSDFKGRVRQSLDALHKGFQQLKSEGFAVDSIEPMGAIYLTLKLDYSGRKTPDGQVLKTSTDINSFLIKQAGLALVPFSAFGTGHEVNWFRASVGASSLQDIEAGVRRIREALLLLS